jgi:uncharacterized membrane protein
MAFFMIDHLPLETAPSGPPLPGQPAKTAFMHALSQSLRRAFSRGIMVVVPVAVIIMVANYVVEFLRPIADFTARRILHADPGTLNLSYTLALVFAVALTLLLGQLANSSIGQPAMRWLERNILQYIPGYRLLMDTVEAVFEPADAQHLKVMLAPVDGWQFAFVMEELPDDELVVFVAQAPVPRTGNVLVFKRSELRETSLTAKEAFNILRQGGKGFTRI